LQAYEKALADNSTLVMGSGNEFFRYMNKSD
ncbi:MAG: protease modulator HflC, partial [Deltaproteobacteria bacterium]